MARSTRRRFLQTASAIAVAPYFVPKSVFGANDRITTGHIGVGGQGRSNLNGFLGKATPVAICDVDQKHLATTQAMTQAKGVAVETFDDYRRLLDRKDIDAVVISTPDHWHAKLTIDACAAGKDVYCEKPLTLTVAEGRKMVEAARKHNRIVQTGSQQRSSDEFLKACTLVRSGHIGKLHTVLVGLPGSNFSGPPVPDSDPPAELNYDMWLGPAPERPYNVKRVHYNFRFFWDYSGGQMTNFGAHHIDIAHWGMDMDNSGPLSIEGEATFHPEKWYEVTSTCKITYKYPNDVTMIVEQAKGEVPGGTTFIGDKGKIQVNRGVLTSEPDELAKAPASAGDVELYRSTNHHQNFLDCIKSRELPICDVEIGHRSATACHLGNIAVRTGTKIVWNAETEQVEGNDAAQAMLSRPYRAPWTLG